MSLSFSFVVGFFSYLKFSRTIIDILVMPAANDERARRNQHIQILLAGIALVVSLGALVISGSLFSFITRPSFLIVEVDSQTSGSDFSDAEGEYRVSGPPGGALHQARINIWNSGQQIA